MAGINRHARGYGAHGPDRYVLELERHDVTSAGKLRQCRSIIERSLDDLARYGGRRCGRRIDESTHVAELAGCQSEHLAELTGADNTDAHGQPV